jgi:hypothetical protein
VVADVCHPSTWEAEGSIARLCPPKSKTKQRLGLHRGQAGGKRRELGENRKVAEKTKTNKRADIQNEARKYNMKICILKFHSFATDEPQI